MLERLKTKLRSGRGGPDNSTRRPSQTTPASASTLSPPTRNRLASTSRPQLMSVSTEDPQLTDAALGLFLVAESTVDVPRELHPVDIIALHGLNGDAYTTWTHKNGKMWIKDILPDYIPGCRVYTYGYAAKVVFSQSIATLSDFSRGLLDAVRNIQDQEGREHRSIIFVCHSLGGIVCKQALVLAQLDSSRYGSLLKSTIGVTFLGTPHNGSDLADIGTIVGGIVNLFSKATTIGMKATVIRSDLLNNLSYDSDGLQELSLSARNLLSKMTVVSFYETQPTPPLSVPVVNRHSAVIGVSEEDIIPLNANHRDVCRFSGETPECGSVCQAIRRITVASQNEKTKTVRTSTQSSVTGLTDLERTCFTLFNVFDVDDYKRGLPRPVEGTCTWIWTHPRLVSWAGRAKSALLWLTGHPGCGKTTLSHAVAQHLEDTTQDVLIYFCDNKVNTQKDAKAILIGLIFQLVHRHRAMVRHIRREYDACGTSMLRSFSILWTVLKNIIKDLKAKTVYIVIDALDECEGSSCHDLLRAIHDLMDESGRTTEPSKNVKFLLTSRPALESTYNADQRSEHRLPIDDGDTGYMEDIRAFVRQRVDQIALKQRWPENTKQYLLQALLERAGQTFLWIHMVLASLEKSFLASIADLNAIISALPPDLEATYSIFLASISQSHQAMAWDLLALLLASSRPLHLDEVNCAFTIKPSHCTSQDVLQDWQPAIDRTIQGILGPLVRISGQKVSLVHQTVKEFLLATDSNGSIRHFAETGLGTPRMTTEKAALHMASACIQYLLLDDFSQDLYSVDRSPLGSSSDLSGASRDSSEGGFFGDFWGHDVPDLHSGILFNEPGILDAEISAALDSKHAFYRYAALHWTEHFCVCDASAPEELRKSAKSLIDTRTASSRNWLHFFSSEAIDSFEDKPDGTSPVILAARFNFLETLVDLLASEDSSQLEKDQALFLGAECGHDQIVAALLEAGSNPDYHAAERQTALTTSAANGHLECVVHLLNSGRCDLNAGGKGGRTALSFAAGNGHHHIVNHLLAQKSCGVEVSDKSGATPFIWAVGGGHTAIISTLAKHQDVDINRQDKTKRTALSWAAGDGMEEVTRYLMQKFAGIDVNLQDKEGRTPLSWAAGNGHGGTVSLLVRSKRVDKNRPDNNQRNPISWACGHGHLAILRVLLNSKCKGVDESDIDGWTPLAWAVHRDAPGVVAALIEAGVSDLEKGSRTVLSWAVEFGHLSVVRELLNSGANPESALDRIPLAEAMGRHDLVAELKSAMRQRQEHESGSTP